MRRPRRPLRRLQVQLRVLDRRRRRLSRRIAAAMVRLGLASRRALRAGILLGVIGGASLAAGALASTFYGQFGYHPGRNADAWATRAPAFIGAGTCAACHAAEATTWASAAHQGVTCESCHGLLAGHPAASPEPVGSGAPVPLLSLDERSSVGLASSGTVGLCLTCHQTVVGRPAGFPTIELATHFVGPDCTVCHDPHSAVAPQPPAILHTLAGLPDCTVCHSPGGMRPLPAAHPTWSGSCLTCHRAIRP